MFERKLKMIRAPIFSLLAVSRCQNFTEDQAQYQRIMQGILRYLKDDAYDLLSQMEMRETLTGWKHVMNDMCLNNELTDVRVVNFPELNKRNLEKQDWFCFAGFLPPGYHQILIFDPKYERAYCKDIIIKMNKRDQVYPEYPIPPGRTKIKYVGNMWQIYRTDSVADTKKLSRQAVKSKFFMGEKYVKNEQDLKDCKKYISQNFKTILNFYKKLQLRSY